MKLRSHLLLANGASIALILVSVSIIYRRMLLSWDGYLLVVSATIGAAAVSLLVHALLTRPLAKGLEVLTAETRRVANGDFNGVVPCIGPREFRQLAAQFNQMADRLHRMFKQLRASETARSELIANVSHDLRTPMASIQAFVEALQDDVVRDPASFERYLHTIRHETKRLGVLIDDLFELSRLEAGDRRMNRQRVAVDTLLLEALESQYLLLREKRVAIDVRIPDRAGAVWIDPFDIKRALVNLLQNALRYAPEGSTVRLEAAASEDEGWMALSIADEGPGLPEADKERVFERFYRADPSRGRSGGEGAGLGLAIVKSIAHRHGGVVGVESEPGKGSRFWLTVPRTESDRNR
ncbi:MAG: HAMP domain-containing histidine kinase [Paenibacillaceae bacterium]|nr:HAMP domain-containing histidine kinase [Paenibacillaceae bacterium]